MAGHGAGASAGAGAPRLGQKHHCHYGPAMEEKGLIRHEAGSKARVYHPALSRDETALAETRTLLDKAFDGSVGLLVNTLIQQNSLTQSDLDGLYEILRQAEEGEEESK